MGPDRPVRHAAGRPHRAGGGRRWVEEDLDAVGVESIGPGHRDRPAVSRQFDAHHRVVPVAAVPARRLRRVAVNIPVPDPGHPPTPQLATFFRKRRRRPATSPPDSSASPSSPALTPEDSRSWHCPRGMRDRAAERMRSVRPCRSHSGPRVGLIAVRDALDRLVLRQAGAVFQFRHADLQDRLENGSPVIASAPRRRRARQGGRTAAAADYLNRHLHLPPGLR